MKKDEFLNELSSRLASLPQEEREERIAFYSEMIDDRIDEGKSEEEAIDEIGGIDKVIADIVEDTPLLSLVKERVKPKRALRVWEIIFLVLGFPLWFPLFLVFALLCLLVYLLIWVGVIVCYAIEASFMACAAGGFVLFFIGLGGGVFSLTYLGAAFFGIGASFLFFFACVGITKATIKLSKVTIRNIKSSFMKKGDKK